jgi:hypothetical protein
MTICRLDNRHRHLAFLWMYFGDDLRERISMKQAQEASCLRFPLFMIGRDSRGNWVVQEQSGKRGGLFIDRAEALRYVRSENGNRPQAVVMITGVLELDISCKPNAPQQQLGVEGLDDRRVA